MGLFVMVINGTGVLSSHGGNTDQFLKWLHQIDPVLTALAGLDFTLYRQGFHTSGEFNATRHCPICVIVCHLIRWKMFLVKPLGSNVPT